MAAFQQKTVVRSYKLRIKNKFKSIVEETENVAALLQSSVLSFKDEVDTLVNNNDEHFFSMYENLDKDLELYREKLFLLLASLEKNPEDEEIAQLEEKHNEATDSNCQQEPVPSLNETSSQTFCKTLLSSVASAATSLSYCSLQDDSQSNFPELQNSVERELGNSTRNNNFKLNFPQAQDTSNTVPKCLQYSPDRNPEYCSTDQNPEYYSTDQNPEYYSADQNPEYYSPDRNPEYYLSSESSSYKSFPSIANVSSPSMVSKNLLESRFGETNKSEICDNFLPSQKVVETTELTILYPDIYVPSRITAILSHIVSPDDFWVQLEDTKELPSFQTMEFGKKIPPLSVQPGDFCLALSNKVDMYYRAEVLTETSVDGKVEVFFIDFGSTQFVPVKNLRVLPDAAYDIPMRAFHCRLSDVLPTDGVWSAASIRKFKEYEGSCEVHVKSCDSSYKYDVELMIETVMGFPIKVSEVLCDEGFAFCKEEFPPQIPSSYSLTDKTSNQQVSHDSGVSVASNQRLFSSNQNLWFSSEMLGSSSYLRNESLQTLLRKTYPQVEITEIEAHTSLESSERMRSDISCETRIDSSSGCSRTDNCDCPLHLVVPPPVLPFVEEGRMLVMLSNIVSPSEFYVNPAMEDNITLDDLLEKMTNFYESHYEDCHIGVGDLKVGMFLAGRFSEDHCWYRVKILHVDSEDDNINYVQVQYTDYGNKAAIRCSDLRPLKPEFVRHPSFALECSLAGIVPSVCTIEKEFSPWDMAAVEAFHELVDFDHCLTAEIVESSILPQTSESVPVLLWDTEESQDLNINEALVSRGVAAFHSLLISNANKEVETLSRWDPMEEEFDGVENSYGVDTDDIGVRISGYKPKDDSRICKYFSLRNGYCPNGDNCSREHVFLAEGGVTRDQEETYSLDVTPSLPAPSTHVLVQVSAVINPGRFYAILPFGNRTVDDIDSQVNRGCSPESWEIKEVTALYRELNEYYSNSPFAENTTVALSFGTIVVAWRCVDSAWHRARIINISDIGGPAQVFYVDFGDEAWVPRKKIREILPQYLHTPFQAIECHLSDVEPLGYEKGRTWSPHSINSFKQMVTETVLLAHITNRCGKVLYLTLRNTRENDHTFISENLVGAGFAQHCSLSTLKGKESIYVPG